nr:MAG TPA: hypothetical protein [Caudoviricetes sp.]
MPETGGTEKPFLLESNLRSIRKPQRAKYILWETLD